MWSVTVHNMGPDSMLEDETLASFYEHPEYKHDATIALEMAKRAGLKSANLTGMRAPNPYGGDEVVDISIRGMASAPDFANEMGTLVREPAPDSLSQKHFRAEEYLENNQCQHDLTPVNDDVGHMACKLCVIHIQNGLLHLQKDCA